MVLIAVAGKSYFLGWQLLFLELKRGMGKNQVQTRKGVGAQYPKTEKIAQSKSICLYLMSNFF